MFDILQGDMTRSKVILTFTCLKMYIARSGDTSGSRTTLLCFSVMCGVVIFFIVLSLFLYVHLHANHQFPSVFCFLDFLFIFPRSFSFLTLTFFFL